MTYNLLSKGNRVVIGVSGGPDSVALLHLLYLLRDEYDLSLHIAHLNHRLRGKASDEEESFVRDLSKDLGLPITIKNVDIRRACKNSGLSIEVQARKERYSFFKEVAISIGAEKIALGHQADDVVETVIMDLLRGSGLQGLIGIPPTRRLVEDLWVIRPLIRVHKEEIEGYLRSKGFRYFIDPSNTRPINLRNRIRLRLIPLLEEYNPNIRRTILRSADIWFRDENYLRRLTHDALQRITIERENGRIAIDLDGLNREDEALRYRILREAILWMRGNLEGFTFHHIENILNLGRQTLPHGMITLPHGVRVKREYRRIYLEEGGDLLKYGFYQHVLNIPGKTILHHPPLLITTEILSKGNFLPNDLKRLSINSTVYIDYDKIEDPVLLRPRLRGDWFRPLGMGGVKKIKDFFIDLKVPIEKRDEIPLLIDKNGIIWVLGYRIDERVKITEETKRVLKITYREESVE